MKERLSPCCRYIMANHGLYIIADEKPTRLAAGSTLYSHFLARRSRKKENRRGKNLCVCDRKMVMGLNGAMYRYENHRAAADRRMKIKRNNAVKLKSRYARISGRLYERNRPAEKARFHMCNE